MNDVSSSYLGYTEEALKEKGAYWTAREIEQQPDAWLSAQGFLESNADVIEQFLRPLLRKPGLRIIFTGAGTSAFAGASIAPSLQQTLSLRIESIATTELVSNPLQYLQKTVPTLLVSFARSGNSPESVAAVSLAERCVEDCYQLVLTCNAEGELYRHCAQNERCLALLMPKQTNDQSFAMTSSFSSMLLSAMSIFSGITRFGKHVDVIAGSVSQLIANESARIQDIANKNFGRVVYLGSSGFKAIAQESSLKLLELTAGKTVTAFDSPLGFRHGPKSIVNSDTLVVVYISNDDYMRKYDLDLLRELRKDAEAGQVIAVAARADEAVCDGDYLLIDGMADSPDDALLFPYVVFAQLYAFHHALRLHNTPDTPSASGTVNRVVQGVIIHECPGIPVR